MLPAPVDDWLRRQELTADASIAPLRPLVAERDGRRLTIQILRDRGGPFLLLSERKLRIAPADIASLGLSPRETEVLAWLAHGKSNAEIAGILGLSGQVRNGYEQMRVHFRVNGDAAPEKLEAIVAQAKARSAVFDVLTNGTMVNVSAECARG